ncbi:hypothetical protein [Kitasatospora sp. NE20-6]|uniref:hypothetical protein n=1 Tax=Kitasatospora sp. NE20-6 TaxID=2859066 RepID=UPI0038B3B684
MQPSPLGSFLSRSRYRLRREVLYNRFTASGYARLRAATRPYLVRPDTALLIEGYPRSANTFCVVAFHMANGTDLRLAHHLHTPVNVERAVRFGVPAIVLVRDPLAAVASHMVRSPWVRPADGLTGYTRFYERVRRLADSLVIADHGRVTTDFGGVVAQANRRFGTDFALYRPSPENDRAAMARIDAIERADSGGALRPSRVPRPHPARQAQLREATARLRDPRLHDRLVRATTVYEDLTLPPA